MMFENERELAQILEQMHLPMKKRCGIYHFVFTVLSSLMNWISGFCFCSLDNNFQKNYCNS